MNPAPPVMSTDVRKNRRLPLSRRAKSRPAHVRADPTDHNERTRDSPIWVSRAHSRHRSHTRTHHQTGIKPGTVPTTAPSTEGRPPCPPQGPTSLAPPSASSRPPEHGLFRVGYYSLMIRALPAASTTPRSDYQPQPPWTVLTYRQVSQFRGRQRNMNRGLRLTSGRQPAGNPDLLDEACEMGANVDRP